MDQRKDFGLEKALFNSQENWFDHNIPNWTRILGELRGQPLNYLEIGSYKGRSACWALLHLLTHEKSRMTAIDPFTGSIEHIQANGGKPLQLLEVFKHNIKQTKQAKKVRIIQDYSQNAMIE